MLRIGAVSYLNTRPLIYGLRDRLHSIGTLELNLPSRLAEDLSIGKLDVALIPSAEYFRGTARGYSIVSDAAIACRGPVWSVRLLSRVPISQIKTLALDVGSRTSAALVQILLSRYGGVRPITLPLEMEQVPENVDADAILMIGDRAMHPPAGVYHEIIDLGQWWQEVTGLPFVFAMWVARPGIELGDLASILADSREDGIRNIDSIARTEAGPNGLTVDDLKRYFTDNLHFYLGDQERQALAAFHFGLIETGQATATVAASNPSDN
ncbi:MAG TPA: hypothetical protein DDZ51_11040 [Planctomycetaceae bacterium]|nr:hypothetical protein [Planctomycetaceae bacterium]